MPVSGGLLGSDLGLVVDATQSLRAKNLLRWVDLGNDSYRHVSFGFSCGLRCRCKCNPLCRSAGEPLVGWLYVGGGTSPVIGAETQSGNTPRRVAVCCTSCHQPWFGRGSAVVQGLSSRRAAPGTLSAETRSDSCKIAMRSHEMRLYAKDNEPPFGVLSVPSSQLKSLSRQDRVSMPLSRTTLQRHQTLLTPETSEHEKIACDSVMRR
jgi:hypothetical protein